MCKLKRKLIIFDYMIDRLVSQYATQHPEASVEDFANKITVVKLTKILYFFCITSSIGKNKIEDTFFKYFDFTAKRLGAVETDIYNNRFFLPRYTFSEGRLRKRDLSDDKVWEELLEVYPVLETIDRTDKEAIINTLFQREIRKENNEPDLEKIERIKAQTDSLVHKLYNKFEHLLFDFNTLVYLSYSLPMWEEAKICPGHKYETDNIYAIKREVSAYLGIKNLQKVKDFTQRQSLAFC